MNPGKTIVVLTIAALTLAIVSSTADSYVISIPDDQIVASFERDFNHQAVPSAPAIRVAIDSDELYQLVNRPLQSPEADNQGEL